MPNTKPSYPPEFKREAIRLVKEGDRKISAVARELGVTGESIRTWIRQHEIDTGQREGFSTSELEELKRLRRETRILKEERDILYGHRRLECSAGDRPARIKVRTFNSGQQRSGKPRRWSLPTKPLLGR